MRARTPIMFLILLALCACGSTAKRNDARWSQWVQITQASEEAERLAAEARSAQFDELAAKCPANDATCIVAIAGFKALAGDGDGSTTGQIPAPPRERDWAEKLGSVAPLIGTLATAAVSWHQLDTSRDVSLSQNSMVTDIVLGTTGAMADVATNATPTITVHGNFGDTYDNDSTTTVGRDQTGRDHQDGSVVGDGNRIGSDDSTCTAGAAAAGGNAAAAGPGGVGGAGGACSVGGG